METKTIEQIKDEVAKKHGFYNWKDLHIENTTGYMPNIGFYGLENEAMQLYAEQYAYQKCEEQKIKCYENAKLEVRAVEPENPNFWNFGNNRWLAVDKHSVLNTPNVCNPKTN